MVENARSNPLQQFDMILPPLAFFAAAALLAVMPGPGILYVVARTVAGGRAAGMASCLGTALGGLVHVAAAALGLSLLLARSAAAFGIVKYAGAAYLVYLGVRTLREGRSAAEGPRADAPGAAAALREGILVEAFNVKTALFYIAFLPQFMLAEAPALPQVLLLGGTCIVFNTVADLAAVLLAHRLVTAEGARAARERLLSRLSGGTMIGLGAWLAFARRQAS